MHAYHDDPPIKENTLNLILTHQRSGAYIQGCGSYRLGRGSFIGMLAQTDKMPQKRVEEALGFPVELCFLADQIFERLPEDRYEEFPYRFAMAIKTGVNLSRVVPLFLIHLLSEDMQRRLELYPNPELVRLCAQVSSFYEVAKPENEWKALIRTTSQVQQAATYTAAYSNTPETRAIARIAYVVNYAARSSFHPENITYVVNSVINCGMNCEVLSNLLISIIKEVEPERAALKPKITKQAISLLN